MIDIWLYCVHSAASSALSHSAVLVPLQLVGKRASFRAAKAWMDFDCATEVPISPLNMKWTEDEIPVVLWDHVPTEFYLCIPFSQNSYQNTVLVAFLWVHVQNMCYSFPIANTCVTGFLSKGSINHQLLYHRQCQCRQLVIYGMWSKSVLCESTSLQRQAVQRLWTSAISGIGCIPNSLKRNSLNQKE